MGEFETLLKTEQIWVVNKQVRQHYDEILPPSVRPAWLAVHRLDFETSGALLFAIPNLVRKLRSEIKNPDCFRKTYLAGASGPLTKKDIGKIEGFIGSRYRSSKKVTFAHEKTVFRGWHSVLPVRHTIAKSSAKVDLPGTLYQIQLETGARHQIRAFFSSAGAALVGDPIYGEKGARLALHAWKLEFRVPEDEAWVKVEAPLRTQ